MGLHIGVRSETGLSHGPVVTAAKIRNKYRLPDLVHGRDQWGTSLCSHIEMHRSLLWLRRGFIGHRGRFDDPFLCWVCLAVQNQFCRWQRRLHGTGTRRP